MALNYTNPGDRNKIGVRSEVVQESKLTRKMDMKNMKKLQEKLAEGMTEVKASQAEMKTNQAIMKADQDEMKTGLTDEIKSVQDKLIKDLQNMKASQDELKTG